MFFNYLSLSILILYTIHAFVFNIYTLKYRIQYPVHQRTGLLLTKLPLIKLQFFCCNAALRTTRGRMYVCLYVCMSVCLLFVHIFLCHFETDMDALWRQVAFYS